MLPLGLKGLRLYDGESEGVFEARTGLGVQEAAALLGEGDTGDVMDVDVGVEAPQDRQVGTRFRPEDMHVDGDILQRLLDRGGESLLREILEEEAESGHGDRVAEYVRDNRERELACVKDVMAQVKKLLGGAS